MVQTIIDANSIIPNSNGNVNEKFDALQDTAVSNPFAERENTNDAYILIGIGETKSDYDVVRFVVNKKRGN